MLLVDVHRSFREACPFHSQSRNSNLRAGAVGPSEMAGCVCRPSNRRTGHAVTQFVEALRYKPEGCGFRFQSAESFRIGRLWCGVSDCPEGK